MLFIFVPAFLFSLVTYFMQEEVFRKWARFSLWFIPIYVIATILATSLEHGGMYDIYSSLGGLLVYILLGVYVIISLVVIIAKYIALRRGQC
jgi:hypothetical protein